MHIYKGGWSAERIEVRDKLEWIEHLPEVGTPLEKLKELILEEMAERDRWVEAQRRHKANLAAFKAKRLSIVNRVQELWTADQIAEAKEAAREAQQHICQCGVGVVDDPDRLCAKCKEEGE